ncbi:MAG: hypothetical protein IJG38_15880 [Thermoguttaceae bacterium]|nr:hypothetical protein [Thermoguttaceae bacterium]
MEGGNGATNGSAVTLCSKGEIPYCAAKNAHWMAPVSGANLMAKAVKECGSLQTPRDRGKPFRSAGSRTYRPPKKTFTFNMKDYIKYLLLLFAAGFLAYWTLAWPMLNLWLQELQVVPDGNQSLPYTIPILILLFVGGVYLCLVALRSRFKSIRIFAHALLIAFFTIVLLLYSYRILQNQLHFGQLTSLLLLYAIVGAIYLGLLYINSSKKGLPQPTDEKEN